MLSLALALNRGEEFESEQAAHYGARLRFYSLVNVSLSNYRTGFSMCIQGYEYFIHISGCLPTKHNKMSAALSQTFSVLVFVAQLNVLQPDFQH